MNSIFWGEFFGTLTLIYFGNGVVANVLLKQSKGEGAGFFMITAGWAMAVTFAVFVAKFFGSASAFLNPAFAIADVVKTGDFAQFLVYVSAEMLGAIVGAALVWLQYLPHWAVTEDQGLKLACFCNSPAIKDTKANFISEFLGTAMFVFAASSLGAVPNGLGPLCVGLLVWGVGMSVGGPTGYAVNPARDLGPRIAHALLPIAGKGDSGWGYAWIPVVGPLAGSIAGSLLAGLA
jgi:glycerol uptake facilitator protein